jgi:hypothetical protein
MINDPIYIAEWEKLQTIQLRHSQLENRLNELLSTPRDGGILAAARHLLDDGGIVSSTAEAESSEQTRLRRERAILGKAIELQRKRVDEAYAAAAQQIRAGFLDRHRAVGRQIRKALDALEKALLDEWEIRDALEELGVGWGYPLASLACPFVGAAENGFERIALWRQSTREYLGGTTNELSGDKTTTRRGEGEVCPAATDRVSKGRG